MAENEIGHQRMNSVVSLRIKMHQIILHLIVFTRVECRLYTTCHQCHLFTFELNNTLIRMPKFLKSQCAMRQDTALSIQKLPSRPYLHCNYKSPILCLVLYSWLALTLVDSSSCCWLAI